MAYIGKSPSQGVRSRFQYQATAGQSSFSGFDANGLTLTYTDSLYMDVYQNGILLVPGDDYTATTGTTVVLVQSASLNDIIEMVVYDVFSVPDAVSQSAGGNFSGDISSGGNPVKVAGKESMWIPAGAMYPSTTNGCSALTQVQTTALRPDLKVLDFAAGADDFAQFSVAFPKSWNEGTITYQPFWTVTGTNTGTVVWQLGGIAVTNDATINTAFGTLVATTALAHSGTSNDLMVSAESGAVTIAGSPSTDDVCFFQINNDTSASGQTGVVRLLGIKLFFTTDAKNDA